MRELSEWGLEFGVSILDTDLELGLKKLRITRNLSEKISNEM